MRSFMLKAARLRPPLRVSPAAEAAAMMTDLSLTLVSKVSSLPLNSPPPTEGSNKGSPSARISSASSAQSMAFMYPSSNKKSGNPVPGFEMRTWSSIIIPWSLSMVAGGVCSLDPLAT